MSAIEDYLQLLNNNPKMDATKLWANKLGNNVITGLDNSLPKGNDPTAMLDWASANTPISHVIGSIRKLSDIVKPNRIPTHRALAAAPGTDRALRLETVTKRYDKYLNNKWATDNDTFVKMLNEGQDITGPVTIDRFGGRLLRDSNNYSFIPDWFLNDSYNFNQIRPSKINSNQARLGIPKSERLKLASDYTTGRPLGVTLDMLTNNQGTLKFNDHVDSLNTVMNQMREVRGTNAIGQTRAAKYFEDVNDLHAVSTIAGKNKRAMVRDLADIVNSNYYKNSVDKPVIFTPEYADFLFGHMADVIPLTNRMSLTDSIGHAIGADRAAVLAEEVARSAEGKNIAFNKKELVHQFDDGTSWNKISDSDALKAEGDYQGHCVGSYCDKVNSGESEIYSLRDINNLPILTAEYNPNTRKMNQVQGKFNNIPNKKFNDHIKTLTNKLDYK